MKIFSFFLLFLINQNKSRFTFGFSIENQCFMKTKKYPLNIAWYWGGIFDELKSSFLHFDEANCLETIDADVVNAAHQFGCIDFSQDVIFGNIDHSDDLPQGVDDLKRR